MEEKDVIQEETLHPDYQKEIVDIVRSKLSPKALKEKLLDYHENDIAMALPLLTRDERVKLYGLLDIDTLVDIFDYAEDVKEYFSELSLVKKKAIIENSEADTAVGYLRQIDKTERDTLINLIDAEAKHDIKLFNSFDEDEIGSKMTTNYVAISEGVDIKTAMRELVRQAAEHDNISIIYVLDENRAFYGAIYLKDLIIAREGTDIGDITVTSYPYVYATELVSDCIERIKDYSEDSIPVLDSENRLIGVVTATDVIEVVDDELGEDYAKLAGLSAEEDLHEPLGMSLKKRLPWLIVLLGLALVVSSVVGTFEAVVAGLPLIMCFQSLILDMSGNVGTQSLAVTIRVLMDERLTLKQKFSLVFKEIKVGFFNGLLLGAVSFVFIGLYVYFLKGHDLTLSLAVSGCTGIALLVAMVLSSLSGTVIPMIFKKMKIDPAVASGPLITTINDLVAVVTYYGLAWILLINVLHLA